MFRSSESGGDGVRPTPPVADSGATAMFVVVSVSGRPSVSKPHVSPRSCSIFCRASSDAKVVCFALALARVATPKSCASPARANVKTDVATSTSRIEKPSLLRMRYGSATRAPYRRNEIPRDLPNDFDGDDSDLPQPSQRLQSTANADRKNP